MCSTDLTCMNTTIQLFLHELLFRINVWDLNKNFQEIKLFICHCSFITLAQKTTMRLQIVRFLETFRRALSWIKTGVVFVHVPHWIAIHFLIHYLPFKNFAVCRIQEFLQCAVRCSFATTCAPNTAEYRLNFAFAFVFNCLFTALHCHWKSELI